ncbi:RNA polymerase II transcription mediator complex subunit 9-domain-containing protein [Coniella lustricola]|uniref:Mediator of RNA polymerase II transcription subunit 9 n=1 Tax=Coniella lustricola TaxID=2025994 RepID=A0A2T2ZT78_9PEZI|nr:RNA polymerase II transcription mediator complex subunit 9-domain-containing protein [Coniella lustricola]
MASSTESSHPLPAGLSPDAIDVPSELATILTRIHYNRQAASAAAATAAAAAAAGAGADAGAGTTADSKPPPAPADDLAPKDLPSATDSLKHKIQHARAAAHTLPDVQRAIAAQDAEIAELHARLAAQRAALASLKDFGLLRFAPAADEAANAEDGDVEMGGLRRGEEDAVARQAGVAAPST